MKRFSLNDVLLLPMEYPMASYQDKVAVIETSLFGLRRPKELFSIDAFAIGCVTAGSCVSELNNNPYALNTGDLFILTPTHTCRLIECSPDYRVRLLLLDSDSRNLSVHLNYLVKSEIWTQTYFNPVIRMSREEAKIMKGCIERIIEQINREECPNKSSFIQLSIVWHHVELDNIMRKQANYTADSNTPLTRQQSLARELYLLIVTNYKTEHKSKFYSDKMCLTPQYLNQITSRIFGKTLSGLISDLLFSTARSMLISSDMSVQEIADELHFTDQASFSKFIKKTSGMSPNVLRKTNPHQYSI